jgi:Flp pilus assembly protein TadD
VNPVARHGARPARAHLRVAILTLVLVCSLRLFPAVHDPWLRIQSANFELFTTAGERDGRSLLLHFEQVRAFFQQAFGRQFASTRPVRLVLFRNDKEFAPYRPSEAAAAFYHPGRVHDFILMNRLSTEESEVATHEYTHLLINQAGIEIPVWLNEGLADLYSTLEQVGSRTVVGTPPPGRGRALLGERWIPLGILVSANRDSPYYNEKSRAGMFYAESWALTHMLSLEKSYRPRLTAMLDAISTSSTAEAFQKAYGKSVEEVQQDLEAYVRSPYLTALSIDVQLPKSVDAPAVETGAALSARLALAELLTDYPSRQTQARAAYEQLTAEYPKSADVESGWARFLFFERHNEEALRHFAHAEELGASDPHTFIEYARALNVAGRAPQAVAALRKAIDLDPENQEAHFDLGLALVRASAWQDAIAELNRALPVARQQASRYFYNVAYAEYRLGDTVAARAYLEQARTYTKIPDETMALDRLSQTLGPAVVEGVLEFVECDGQTGKLHVRVNGFLKTFLTPDLSHMQGLECGSHPAAQVRIEYQPLPPGSKTADGIARSLR